MRFSARSPWNLLANRRTLTALFIFLLSYSTARPQQAAVQQLHELFAQAWERKLREDPLTASYLGDKRYNARWPDWSAAALARQRRDDEQLLARLQQIPGASLPVSEQVNRELFQRLYARRVAWYDFKAYERPLDQLNYSGSIQTLSEIPELLAFDTERDYEDWIARLRSFDVLGNQVIALARAGMKAGNLQPRIVMKRTLSQVQAQRVAPETSAFFAPFRELPASIPEPKQEALRSAALAAVRTSVLPTFAKLERFITTEYLPASRTTVGIWDTPHGAEYYRHSLAWFTTTTLNADEIHQIGLNEVARIRAQMDQVIASAGFKGTFAEFLHHLRTDPQFHHPDAQALMQAYMVMAKRIDPLLPQYFGHLPRTPYGVREIPASTAPDTTTAYYQPSSADGRRAGYFYVNLYRPDQRPTYEIPVLTAHEAVPGHHLQQALAQETGELPNFRRDFEATAFVEGWALYAESLGDEMGLYSNPYDKFGQLTYEMWRAVRLVVDTGIHHKRWTREQAIAFFKENAAKSELDIFNEVDRYIAWPGQATAYKVGELKFKELRRKASEQLGDRFDLRDFHDQVLRSGALPLDVLERMVDEWIASRRAAAR